MTAPSSPAEDKLHTFTVRVLDTTATAWLCEDQASKRIYWLRKNSCVVENGVALVPDWVARDARWIQ